MKHYKRLVGFSFFIIFLLTACVNTSDNDPSKSPAAMSGPPILATPYATDEPTPSATQTPKPTASPDPTPIPDLTLPIDLELVSFEFSDDDAHLYIKTQYPDPSIYSPGSTGALMAEDILNDLGIYYNRITSLSEEAPATSENLLSYGLTAITEIANNGSKYLSVYVDYYIYAGGAHGIVQRVAYTYSSTGSRILDFTEILNDNISAFDVEDEINRQIKAIIDDGNPAFYSDKISFDDSGSYPPFYIKDGRLIIYYQVYDIAPHAYGIPQFEMPAEFFKTP